MKIARRIVSLVLLMILVSPLIAQHDDHEHHSMHGSGELNLQLSEVGKWASDDSLRQGMSELRKVFEPAHRAYRNNEFDTEQAVNLADAIDEQVNFMFANCRLPADADAELHKLLAAAHDAAQSLRESEDLHDGLHRLHRVLRAYPEYFQHPDWSD